jgi:hypothetical protein
MMVMMMLQGRQVDGAATHPSTAVAIAMYFIQDDCWSQGLPLLLLGLCSH